MDKAENKNILYEIKNVFFPVSEFDLSLTPTKGKINLIGVLGCNRAMSCLAL